MALRGKKNPNQPRANSQVRRTTRSRDSSQSLLFMEEALTLSEQFSTTPKRRQKPLTSTHEVNKNKNCWQKTRQKTKLWKSSMRPNRLLQDARLTNTKIIHPQDIALLRADMQAMNQSLQQSVGASYDEAGGKQALTRTAFRTTQIRGHGWDIGKAEDVPDVSELINRKKGTAPQKANKTARRPQRQKEPPQQERRSEELPHKSEHGRGRIKR
eukprot:IDg22273t1